MAKEITTESIKELRDATGISVMQCKKALEEAGGDMEKAFELLKTQSAAIAAKKSDRALGAGTVAAYIHGGDAGALVVLSSETDFVGRNEEFKKLAYDIAMHVVAARPKDNDELLAQPFIKDESVTVKELIERFVQKFGERIEVGAFTRYSVK
ncbi:MAG: translation elongation factor Ts [bacterium]|nr:translation elongation factor Ts [bacterium]